MMMNHRPWKSSSASPLYSSLQSPCNGDSLASVPVPVPVPVPAPPKRSTFLVLVKFTILLIGGSLLIWQLQQPEDYGVGNKAAICAIQKGAVKYLDEWVQYHLLAMGFEDIYLYDNSVDFELASWHQSYDTQLQQRIHIRHFPGPTRQNKAYTNCVRQIQKARSHAWIAFIDIDEFVVLRDTERHPYISDFLESLPPGYGGLAMNWVVFRMNNQMHYEDLPVTLRFQNRSEDAANRHIKTIARTHLLRKISNPHHVDYLLFRWWIHTYDTEGSSVDGPFNHAVVDNQIALYHYASKSLEEYKERCSRGRADAPMKEAAKHLACKSDNQILKNERRVIELTKDESPWQLLRQRVPSYANKYTTT